MVLNAQFARLERQMRLRMLSDQHVKADVSLNQDFLKQAQDMISESAQKAEAPFVNFKWLGGLLTNFEEIRKNIKEDE